MTRLKASQRPSGETSGLTPPDTCGGGLVNCFFSPVSSETTNKASDFLWPNESVTTKQSLAGHQARNVWSQ